MDNPFDQFDSAITPPALGGVRPITNSTLGLDESGNKPAIVRPPLASAVQPVVAPALKTAPKAAPNPFDKFDSKEGNPFDKFDNNPEGETGYLDEIKRGLKAGATVQLPKMVGQAAKFFGAEEVGDNLIKGAEARDTPDVQESPTGQAHDSPLSVRGNVYEAATNAVPSLAPGVAGAAVGAGIGTLFGPGPGTAAGALAGYAIGSIASLPIFYGSQAQDSYEAVKKTQLGMGKSEAEADSIAKRTAHIEGSIEAGGEVAADVIPFVKIFKPFAKAGAAAAGQVVKDVFFPGIKTAAKTVGGIVGAEVGTEMAQQAGEDYARKASGDTGPGATLEETAKVVMPTALMSLIPGMAGAGARHVQARRARAALESPDTDAETRSKIALGAVTSMQEASPDTARAFAVYAKDQIDAGKPIELSDDQTYLAYASAKPAETAPGGEGTQVDSAGGTSVLGAEPPPAPKGPMAQAAEIATTTGLSQRHAEPFFPFTEQGAQRRAAFLNSQGQASRVTPHPEHEGRFAIIPDEYGAAKDDDSKIKALENEGNSLIERLPKGRLMPAVQTRIREIDAEIEKMKGDAAAVKEKAAKKEEQKAKEKAAKEKADAALKKEAEQAERQKQADLDKLAAESAVPKAKFDDMIAAKTGELDEQPTAMQLALKAAKEKAGRKAKPAPAPRAREATAAPATASAAATVDEAAHAAASSPKNDLAEPTEAQIGKNATLGHAKVGPFDISIENPEGSVRKSKADSPVQWERKMADHYGYFRAAVARAPDKEHVDAFVKPGTPTDHVGPVYVVDQNHPDGKHDEAKVMVGYPSREAAVKAYLGNYQKGWESRVRGVTELSTDEMRKRLNDPDAFLKPQPEAKPIEGPKVTAYPSKNAAHKLAREVEQNFKTAQKVVPHPTEAGKFAIADEIADERLTNPDLRTELAGMAKEAGWAQEGGKMLRNAATGEITRTTWIPNAAWFPGRPGKLNAKQVQEAVRKGLAGERLSVPEKRTVQYMLDNAQRTMGGGELASSEVDSAGYNELTDAERAEVDELIAHAESVLGEDKVEALRERTAIASEGSGEAAYADALKEKLNEAIQTAGESGAGDQVKESAGSEPRADSGRDEQAAGQPPEKTESGPAAETVVAQPATEPAVAPANPMAAVADALRTAADAIEKSVAPKESAIPAPAGMTAPSQEDAGTPVAADDKPAFSIASNAPVWYSALTRAVQDSKTVSAPAAQWKATLKNMPGVKAEVEASGVGEWLDMREGKVTRDQVAEFLRQNGVRVEETALGSHGDFDRLNSEYLATEEREIPMMREMISAAGVRGTDAANLPWWAYEAADGDSVAAQKIEALNLSPAARAIVNEYGAIRQELVRLDALRVDAEGGKTKFASYQLPGGENYRELLLTLPQKINAEDQRLAAARAINSKLMEKYGGLSEAFEKWTPAERIEFDRVHAEAQKAPPTLAEPGFKSSHFSEPNILAHIRFNERKDAEGKRVLFVEEIQSDWAQNGKREGFQPKNLAALEARRRELESIGIAATPAQKAEWASIMNQIRPDNRDIEGISPFKGVPSAPFVGKTEAWVALALKRMIRYAAENGFDSVAWTNGEQQAARYDLSKQVEEVNVFRRPDGKTYDVSARTKGDRRLVDTATQISESALSETIGKDLAAKAVQQTPESWKTYSGLDLKVGGEGMRAFYDKIVPNVANDVLKKLGGGRVQSVGIHVEPAPSMEAYDWGENADGRFGVTDQNGVQVEEFDSAESAQDKADELNAESQVPGGLNQQSGFIITPELRDKVMGGMPMFKVKPEPKSGLSVSDIKSHLQPILARWKNAPKVEFHQTLEDPDVPKAIREATARKRSAGVKGRVQGVWYSGTAHLFADAIKSRDDATMVLFHEVLGHYGLNKTFGPKMQTILKQVSTMRFPEVSMKALQYGLNMESPGDRMTAAEEVLADMAQTRPEIGFVKRAIAAIREFLRSIGVKLELSDNDIIANFIVPAREFVEGGRVDSESGKAGEPMFSLGGTGALSALQSSPRVAGYVSGLMQSSGKLGMLNGINTQYHKALALEKKGYPGFKKVFDKTQDYLNDITATAVTAEQEAPGIFRELRGIGIGAIRKYFKGAATDAEIQSIQPALHVGTLFGGGNPMDGRKWSDEELKFGGAILPVGGANMDKIATSFKKELKQMPAGEMRLPGLFEPLTDKGIELYKEARAAVDRSLEDQAKSLIYRNIRSTGITFDKGMNLADVAQTVQDGLDEAISAGELHISLLADQLNTDPSNERAKKVFDKAMAESADLKELKKTVAAIEAKANKLIEHGYMPLQRFGNRVVTAKDKDGKTQFVGFYDGNPLVPKSADVEMNRAAMALRHENPTWTVTTERKSERAWELYSGLNLDALENFLDFLDPETKANLERDATIQEYMKNAVNSRSTLTRMVHRKGTAGFSTDIPRTLASFITSNARSAASNYHGADMKSLVEDIKEGDIKDEAADLVKYILEPKEEAAKLRSFLFFHFLGGSIAAGLVNLSQTPMMTAPALLAHAGLAKVTSALGKAAKMAVQDPKTIAGKIGEALHKAEMEGLTAPQMVHHLTAVAANNPFTANRQFRTFMTFWGGMFSTTEVFNRRVAFLAAYDIAAADKTKGDPYEFAKGVVNDTQLLYNKGNRPNLARGALGATVLTFKTFSIGYLELLRRMPPQQQLIMLGMLVLMAGAEGLPFAEDIEDLVDTLGQWLGFNTNTGKWLGKTVRDTLGPEFERPLLKGLGGMLPLDLHSRLGMGNLLPATAYFKQSEIDKTRDVAEAVGPLGGVLKNLSDSLQMLARGRWDKAAVNAAPAAVRNAYNGAHMLATGEAEDIKGRKTLGDVTLGEGLGKAIGFNPQRAAAESETKREIMQDRNLRTVRMDEIAGDWADGILRSDAEKIADARGRLRQWNTDNPELRIMGPSLMRSISERVKAARMSGQDRFLKSVPKPMRESARQDLNR